ncbi:MAG: M23 family metallopeptidase [Treponema sp.]|nr:M23 family metallopeptidase [Treponema sp.]
MSTIVVDQHISHRSRVKPRPVRQKNKRNSFGEGFVNKMGGANYVEGSSFLASLFGRHSRSALSEPLPVRTEFIQQIKQRPARLHRVSPKPRKAKAKAKAKGQGKALRRSLFSRLSPRSIFAPEGLFPMRSPAFGGKIVDFFSQGAKTPKAEFAAAGTSPRYSFPLSPFIAALVTILISIAAISWKSPVVASLLGEDTAYLKNAGMSGEVERNLADYAGIDSQEIYGSHLGLLPQSAESEAIPLDMMETFSWQEYKVKKGDTLSGIAVAQQLSMGTLIASNNITNARKLREGEILRLPNMDGLPYTVKNGDSLSGISAATGVPLQVILDVNDLQSDVINPGLALFLPGARMAQEEIRLAMGESFIYPVRGVQSSNYGWRIDPIANVSRFHSAIDLAAPQGTPVNASMDGRISRVAVNSVYGNYIIITHQGGYQTLYAHLSVVSVKQGALVSQGSKIGEVGSTGYSTGPHLHFSVFKNNKVINPLEVLKR